jgi:hypothetical protein
MKLTFKQYLESKNQLIEAVQRVPRSISKYRIKKYCTFVVGESEVEKNILSLKPNQHLEIEWIYENIHKPTRGYIKLIDNNVLEEELVTFWDDKKITKWLQRYTVKLNNTGH